MANKISIITINKNNSLGLRKTMESVFNQSLKNIEYIVVDGASTDDSIKVIRSYENCTIDYKWISEPDSGIYSAMNKGIRLASGDYLQFLNSGDLLCNENVLSEITTNLDDSKSILYGNMIKTVKNKPLIDRGFISRQPTLLDFYTGTLNHSPSFIKKSLFDQFGLYDENLKIVSDWKWFLEVIILNDIKIDYLDLNITNFDMFGISNTNKVLEISERKNVFESILPQAIIKDYADNVFLIEQIRRIKRYKIIYILFYFVERVLFKLEKRKK